MEKNYGNINKTIVLCTKLYKNYGTSIFDGKQYGLLSKTMKL